MGIGSRSTLSTPYAVLDLETTGLQPGQDRIVEIAVVRLEPGRTPEVVLDTLVNPRRRVAATEIHGISDADVVDAPAFSQVAGDVLAAVSGAVLVAHNAYFDMRFLRYELRESGVVADYPYLCTMYLRCMLGLGERCRLDQACARCGVEIGEHHTAAADALAAARLLQHYLARMTDKYVRTFSDLARRGSYKFCETWSLDLPAAVRVRGTTGASRWKSRYFSRQSATTRSNPSSVERVASAIPSQQRRRRVSEEVP